MEKLNRLIVRRSKLISILLLIICFAMFFIPCIHFTEDYILLNTSEASAFLIVKDDINFINAIKDSIDNPQEGFITAEELTTKFIIDNAKATIIILIMFLSLWIILFLSIFLSKRKPYFFLWSLLPLSVISIYCIYNVIGWATYYQPPHIGVFIYAAVLVFEFLCFVAFISKLVRDSQSRNQSPHKPTKTERIAELERQVSEWQSKEKDAD